MGFFTTAQANALAEKDVRLATLVEFDFADSEGASDPVRLWNGFGDLSAGGQTWTGIAGLGAIEGLEETRGPISVQTTFTLSGVDQEIQQIAIADPAQVQGHGVSVNGQLLTDEWQTEGSPFALWAGVMQPPRISRTAVSEEEGGQRLVRLPAENVFFKRARIPAGRYTGVDQKSRFAGDKFCDNTALMVNITLTWPNY